jgi:hypothetical protein
MKTAWSIVSFLAVVHLLALVMFVGWLHQSGRLDRDRIELLRETFALTIEQAAQQAAEAERTAEEERRRALEEFRREKPPVPSAAQVRHISHLEEIESRSMRRLHDERAALAAQIADALASIEAREAALEADRTAWLEAIEAERARRSDEQFAKTVRQYESVPPRQAKGMLLGLVAGGRTDQAVAYLDAMNPRAAAKIIQEFKNQDELALATDLLERLRRLGLPPSGADPAAQSSAHDDDLADARR